MSELPLAVVVTPVFMDRLFGLEQYIGRENPARGRRFVDELFDFIYSAVGPYPLAFPAYVLANHPTLSLRRAVFQRRYNLIYEVTTSEVKFLTVFGTAQSAADVSL
ncbi:hypothetical protein [Hymenobacter sp.]|uniref:hypothetical protein n=1 Tax=Hymenobacter sp. TaxID=1898978 RepID=UPI00286C222D|nr:hypothetical protein [Hymenobacter sp.]